MKQRVCLILFLMSVSFLTLSTAQVFTENVQFNGSNGDHPYAGLIQGFNGNFYGTTEFGGKVGGKIIEAAGFQAGSIYSFSGPDGEEPTSPLIQLADGSFYGTTASGGQYGSGTIFRLYERTKLQILHSFNLTDGALPSAGLLFGSDGNLYGTTNWGGNYSCNANYGCGTIFRITTSGKLTTLHVFNGTDGANPAFGSLIEAPDGNFYGTTSAGGTGTECHYDGGCGTVFKITSSGVLTTLYNFCPQSGCADGAEPAAGLTLGPHGYFYGTTMDGASGYGTIFRMSPAGQVETIHAFSGLDGFNPTGGLTRATDGKFYGAAYNGGPNNCHPIDICGTVFRITADGGFQILHQFDLSDGAAPVGNLLQATTGILYGTTSEGGWLRGECYLKSGCGTIFSIDMGIGPFVRALSAFGKVGSTVVILGSALSNATAVSFSGVSAQFKVLSDTEIKTLVPRGATNGYISVTVGSQTLKSDVPFIVE